MHLLMNVVFRCGKDKNEFKSSDNNVNRKSQFDDVIVVMYYYNNSTRRIHDRHCRHVTQCVNAKRIDKRVDQ